MSTKTSIRLVIAALMTLFLGITSLQAEEQAGIVIISSGDVFAKKTGIADRPLKRRSKFYTGEVIIVGDNGKAQVRFQDGTILSLTRSTELRIEAFNYSSAEDSDDTNIVTLLKGGFRTITGAVAKKNPSNHIVKTPVATIGVRGTNYSVALNEGAYVGVWDGVVRVENEGGQIDLGAQQDYNYAVVADSTTAPQGLLEPPGELVATVAVDGETAVALNGDPIPATPETNLFNPITTPQFKIDRRLVGNEVFDSIGFITRLSNTDFYGGGATSGLGGSPIVRNSTIDPNTGFSDAIIRKGNAVAIGGVTNITVGTKETYWGTWDATVAGQEATVQSDPGNPNVLTKIQDTVFWMTAQPTDDAVLASLNTTGVWSGAIAGGQFDGVASNGSTINSLSFNSTLDFSTGAVTGTSILATTTLADTWNVNFLDGTLNGASIDLTANSATSTFSGGGTVTGDLHGVVTGDNAEGIASTFSVESTVGEKLDGRFVSTNCGPCP